jgi:type IV secretion system protein VirB10
MKQASELTPKVAGSAKAGKYIILAVFVILVVILAQGFFTHNKPQVAQTAAAQISVADTAATPLNLNYAVNPPPTTLPPLPVRNVAPPPPPSVLRANMNFALGREGDYSRLKSPTQVYSADNSSVNASANTAGSADPNNGFAQQAANAAVITVSAKQDTNMDFKILQGKFIAAVLETSINSDMPGMVRAIVSKDIYSDTGKYILIPRGTRLIGLYNSSVAVGQSRVMIVWTRAITPQHLDIALGSPNADNLGQSGMDGIVDSHFWQIFGTSALLSVLGVAASSMNPGSSSGDLGVAGNPYQLAVAQGVTNASNNVLQGRINIKPTIHVPQGSGIQVFVARDLDFSHLAASV